MSNAIAIAARLDAANRHLGCGPANMAQALAAAPDLHASCVEAAGLLSVSATDLFALATDRLAGCGDNCFDAAGDDRVRALFSAIIEAGDVAAVW